MSVDRGDKAPDFELPATGGRRVSLAAMKGRPFVLYFYPKADTPGCTKEACAFQESWPELDKVGAEVIGVSKDDIPALEKFAQKYGLKFPLASDKEGKVAEAYGAWGEKRNFMRTFLGMKRTTFLINADGDIARVWRNVKVEGHAAQVMAAVYELETGLG